jgi:uncharacterized membrane protein YidH (DUF202 family)
VTESPRVFDPGLQPERTLMSWQRTTLALMAGIAAGVHYVASDLGGAPAIFAGVTAIALAIAAYAGAHRRYIQGTRELLEFSTLRTISAWPLLLLAVVCLSGGIIAVLFAVSVLL